MFEVSKVGVDLAKNVIQDHGVDANGNTMVRRQLRRNQFLAFFERQPHCLIGMEACSCAHHWGRVSDDRPRGSIDASFLREALCQAW